MEEREVELRSSVFPHSTKSSPLLIPSRNVFVVAREERGKIVEERGKVIEEKRCRQW